MGSKIQFAWSDDDDFQEPKPSRLAEKAADVVSPPAKKSKKAKAPEPEPEPEPIASSSKDWRKHTVNDDDNDFVNLPSAKKAKPSNTPPIVIADDGDAAVADDVPAAADAAAKKPKKDLRVIVVGLQSHLVPANGLSADTMRKWFEEECHQVGCILQLKSEFLLFLLASLLAKFNNATSDTQRQSIFNDLPALADRNCHYKLTTGMAVAKPKSPYLPFLTQWRAQLPENYSFPSVENRSRVIGFSSTEDATSFINFFSTTIYKRMRKLVNFKLTQWNIDAKFANITMNVCFKTEELPENAPFLVVDLVRKFKQLATWNGCCDNWPMTEGNMKKYPERFLLLQQYLMEEYEASQGKLKPIPLGPSRGFVAPYLHFDKEGLSYFLSKHKYPSLPTTKERRTDPAFINKFFASPSNLIIDSISTNGTTLNVYINIKTKQKVPKRKGNKTKKKANQKARKEQRKMMRKFAKSGEIPMVNVEKMAKKEEKKEMLNKKKTKEQKKARREAVMKMQEEKEEKKKEKEKEEKEKEEKEKKKEKKGKKKKSEEEEESKKHDQLKYVKEYMQANINAPIIGLDTGNHNILSTYGYPESTFADLPIKRPLPVGSSAGRSLGTSWRLSNAQWRNLTGMTRTNSIIAKWKQNAGIHEIEARIPTIKTCNTDKLLTRLTVVAEHMNTLRTFYSSRKWRSIKFQNYSKRQHVMATKLNELHATYTSDRNERVVVIVGDGQFPTMRGHAASPYRKFVDELKRHPKFLVAEINEWGTSSTCCNCGSRALYHMYHGESKIWGLKHCSKCNTLFDRDDLGSINILNKFKGMCC